ncbi:hypothetical protein AOQ84DRAFT_373757 [Glonium stellatum]|uniref:C2H2-type domain-containing protein n=1 Tax=Glonium stellatum TaxID=574774 RepID=A0A8E2F6X6_9PEZI|nr:hypothetical protein AOQ84DRAFT_373757 [Glonium stellatum]
MKSRRQMRSSSTIFFENSPPTTLPLDLPAKNLPWIWNEEFDLDKVESNPDSESETEVVRPDEVEEEQRHSYRRRKKRWSAGIFKRSHSQSVGSNTDTEDSKAFDTPNIGSSARRLRRRARGPDDNRASLILDELLNATTAEVEESDDIGTGKGLPSTVPNDGSALDLPPYFFGGGYHGASRLVATAEDYDSGEDENSLTTRKSRWYGESPRPGSTYQIVPQDACSPGDAHESLIHEDLQSLRHAKTISSPGLAREANLETLSDSFATATLSDTDDSLGDNTEESGSISHWDALSEPLSPDQSAHERNPAETLTQQVHSFYTAAMSAVVETLMKELYAMLNPEFGMQSCAGNATTNACGQAKNSNSSTRAKNSSGRNNPGKRSARGNDENEQGDEKDDNGSKRRKRDDDPDDPDDMLATFPGRRFACPFFQRNPIEHKGRACRYPGFTGIHRLKEHLYRCHIIIHCKRCRKIFKTESELENHQRQTEPCRIGESELPEGLNSEQVLRLRSKKKFGNERNEEGRWMAIYHFLFPDEDVTLVSPYCEPDRAISPESKVLKDFERFAQREFPRRVREKLERLWEREAQQVGDRLKIEFMNVVRDCQTNLFKDYKDYSRGMMNEDDEEILATMVKPLPPTDDQTPNPGLQDFHAQKRCAHRSPEGSQNLSVDTSTPTLDTSTRSSGETLASTVIPDELLLYGSSQADYSFQSSAGPSRDLFNTENPSFISKYPLQTIKESTGDLTESSQPASFNFQYKSQDHHSTETGVGIQGLWSDSSLSHSNPLNLERFKLQTSHNRADSAFPEREGVLLDTFGSTWPLPEDPFDASFGNDAFE